MTVAERFPGEPPFEPGKPFQPGGPLQPGPSPWPSPGPGQHPWPGAPEPAAAPVRVWPDTGEGPRGLYERLLEHRIVMAHGHLDDEAATRLSAQLLTLDAEGDDPVRFELQNLTAGLGAALTVMGVLDTVGVPVRAQAGGQVTGPALGVLAACTERRAYPNAVFAMSEPAVEFDGSVTELASREEQVTQMLDSLYFRLAEVTGREVNEIRDDSRGSRILTADEAVSYGLVTGRVGVP